MRGWWLKPPVARCSVVPTGAMQQGGASIPIGGGKGPDSGADKNVGVTVRLAFPVL